MTLNLNSLTAKYSLMLNKIQICFRSEINQPKSEFLYGMLFVSGKTGFQFHFSEKDSNKIS